MYEVPRDGLPRPLEVRQDRAPLVSRSPGEAWRRAEAGLPIPKPDPEAVPTRTQRRPDELMPILDSYWRSLRCRRARSAEEV